MNIGASNRTIYDNCQYQKRLYESTSPLQYKLNFAWAENCNKCLYDKFWLKYQLVDVESELKNLSRPLSNCDQFKYQPHPNAPCARNGMCISTFHKNIPVVPAPDVCPIVYNNIPKQTSVGYSVPNPNICN